ncbi:MAG: alkaline phosphatase D family protein [Rhodospirillaceae bacterium]|nr:alkaline phosphatase D family protein [Rhodospirillaceae bacterium]
MSKSEPARERIGRRSVIVGGASAGAIGALSLSGCHTMPAPASAATPPASHLPRLGALFALGVASGEPLPHSVVLWTRLAPDPLNGGGMAPAPVPVRWEIAEDEQFKRIRRRGTAIARAEWAHSVHVEVAGLDPGRWYWYRFAARGETSPVGRTRTAPAPGAAVDRLRFAAASCQDFQNGYYSAYRHMAREDLDFVLFLGDYIYEYAARPNRVRRHVGGDCTTLADYRNRYAQYRTDADLQAAHARFPWFAIPDDHEVQNDYAGDHSEKLTPRAAFLRQRAAAYRAYFEHMPLSPAMAPRGDHIPIFRRRRFGSLLDLFLLDERQYRTAQACPGPRHGGQVVGADTCAELRDPRRTMLGAAQERWLGRSLSHAQARWTAIGQQLLMASLIQPTREGNPGVWTDGWDGYPLARQRLIDRLVEARVPNPIILGGDIHSFWVTDIKRDFRDATSPTVASEFVATSISSSGVPQIIIDAGLKLPYVKFAASRWRGYLRCTVTPRAWQTDLQAVETIARPDAALTTLRRFVVEPGRPGPQAI